MSSMTLSPRLTDIAAHQPDRYSRRRRRAPRARLESKAYLPAIHTPVRSQAHPTNTKYLSQGHYPA